MGGGRGAGRSLPVLVLGLGHQYVPRLKKACLLPAQDAERAHHRIASTNHHAMPTGTKNRRAHGVLAAGTELAEDHGRGDGRNQAQVKSTARAGCRLRHDAEGAICCRLGLPVVGVAEGRDRALDWIASTS